MEDKLIDILQNFRNDESYNELNAVDDILRLFNVVGQSEQLNCEHEWKVEAFDCHGMPYEQYCEHCGKKESV
jgi:hypothetical protein